MRKCDELTNPNSCMSRARDDEITFVLLERDDAAPKTIRYWIRERIEMGLNQPGDPKMVDAEQCALAMEAERALSTQNVLGQPR
jgi:predicted naringenin-chalcone synthase